MASTMQKIVLATALVASSFLGNTACPGTWVELNSSDKAGKKCTFSLKVLEGSSKAVKTAKIAGDHLKGRQTWDECKQHCIDDAEKSDKEGKYPRYCVAASLLIDTDGKSKTAKQSKKTKDDEDDADEDKEKKADAAKGTCTYVIVGKGVKVDELKWQAKDGKPLENGNHCAAYKPGITSAEQGFKADAAKKKKREGEDEGQSFVGGTALRSITPHSPQIDQ